MTLSALIHVLYDPVSWSDPEWLARFGVDARWPRRFANRVMLRRAELANVRREDCDGALVSWLVSHWAHLPSLAYLAGARLARQQLAAGNGLTKLQFNALGFLSLPIPLLDRTVLLDRRPAPLVQSGIDADQLALASGASCVAIATRALSPGWQQRIRLRFPCSCGWRNDADSGGGHIGLAPSVAFKLLQSSIHFYHAENH